MYGTPTGDYAEKYIIFLRPQPNGNKFIEIRLVLFSSFELRPRATYFATASSARLRDRDASAARIVNDLRAHGSARNDLRAHEQTINIGYTCDVVVWPPTVCPRNFRRIFTRNRLAGRCRGVTAPRSVSRQGTVHCTAAA